MNKEKKTDTNNQWTSTEEGMSEGCGCGCGCKKKEKTATDNQWTTTAKNDMTNKK